MPTVAPTGEALNSRLRECALVLFEAGYEATTAEDIAQAAGISRRTFFRYFPVKEDVLFSDHAGYLVRAEQVLAAGRGEPITVAGSALHPLLEGLLADPDFTVRRSRVIASNPPLRDREVLWYREYQRLLAQYLAEQRKDDRSTIFAEIVAAAILAALGQVIGRWAHSPDTESPTALFAELLDDIADSMGNTGIAGRGPGSEHPERTPADRTDVVVINSRLSATEIASLIEKAES